MNEETLREKHLDLVRRYLEGTATGEEGRELESLLQEQPGLRREYLRYANLDAALAGYHQSPLADLNSAVSGTTTPGPVAKSGAPAQTVARGGWWRPITAAAAGLALGLGGATWAGWYGRPAANAVVEQVVLIEEGFEKARPPGGRGVPGALNEWGGDAARIVGPQRQVTPREGGRMLQILQSNYEGEISKLSHVGDQLRVLDLADHAGVIDAGRATVAAAAWFNVDALRPEEAVACGVQVFAFRYDPTVNHAAQDWKSWLYSSHLALAGEQQGAADRDPGTWEQVTTSMPLPPETRFLIVHVRINRTQPAPAPEPVKFAGAYADEVTVDLLVHERRLQPAHALR